MSARQPSKIMKGLLAWLRKPESWLSIAAVGISAFTFYVVYENPGDLRVFIADEVGLGLKRDSTLFLVLPLTIINTGAGRKSRVVEGISSTITEQATPGGSLSYPVSWRVEFTFVGKNQYLQKYPAKVSEPSDPRVSDYLDYNGRAMPFTIAGGSSSSKILGLYQDGGKFAGQLHEFTLKVRLRVRGETVESQAQFDCGERTLDAETTHYCRRKV
jgi:hypothetical protein